MPSVLATTHRRIRVLSLHRPDRLNAVSDDLYRELAALLQAADADDEIRGVVLQGSGRAFCVGADLKAHGQGTRTKAERSAYVALGQDVCRQIQTMATPVVAAVHGYALGAGAEIAISADFLVMANDAQMGFPEISIGTFVGGGVTHRLPRLVGLRRATDLLMLGERFTGTDAAEWGLCHSAVPAEELEAAALLLADSLALKAPIALARMKASLSSAPTLDQALSSEAGDLVALMDTEDWTEGVAAFGERRTPVFTGR